MTTPSLRRSAHIENLETRRMMAFAAEINFQPWWARNGAADVTSDIGFPFRENGSYAYGWNHWKANDMIARNGRGAPQASQASFVNFNGAAGSDDRWEIAVPNGSYAVTLSAGDSNAIDSYYAFEVEGENALRGTPTWNQRWLTSTVNVVVTDGRLTVMAGEGASNNKLNSIKIDRLTPDTVEAPRNLTAKRIDNDSIQLDWSEPTSKVEGYVLQHSANGGEWLAAAYRADGSSRIVLDGIDSSVPNTFRVFSYTGELWSSSSNVVRVDALPKPTPTPTPTPDPTPPPTPTPAPGTQYFDGVTVNPEYDPYAVAAALKTLGVNAVRIWGDIEWNKFVNRNFMDAARAYHNLGFHVTLLITDDKVPTPEQARAYFNFAVSQPGMKAAVDRWEIINEPNFGHYWTGTLTEYVTNVLKPAYEVLKANGETVVGAAPGIFTDVAQQLKDAGYLNYVDYANYHPYGDDAATQIQRINDVKRIFAGKPLTLTEWNLIPYGATSEKWISELNKVRNFVTANVESAFYFHMTFTPDWVSASSLFKTDASGYVSNGGFYEMYDGWDIKKAA